MNLSGLEFTNSRLYGFEGIDSSTWQERLSRLPEVYESLTSLRVGGVSDSPPRIEESEGEGEASPPGALAQPTLLTSPPILGTYPDLPTEGTPVVKVPDKNPSCPCCGNRIGKMSGLIEHLKRVHGKKKRCFSVLSVARLTLNIIVLPAIIRNVRGLKHLPLSGAGPVRNVGERLRRKLAWDNISALRTQPLGISSGLPPPARRSAQPEGYIGSVGLRRRWSCYGGWINSTREVRTSTN